MKKNILMLSLLSIFISFLFAMPVIDYLSGAFINSTLLFYDNNHNKRVGVNIELKDKDIDSYSFFEKVNDLAVKNNLAIYVLSQQTLADDIPEVAIYTSTNDIFLNKIMMLKNGYATGISNKETYSTYSTDKNHRILDYMMNVELSVNPLNKIGKTNIYMHLINLDGDEVSNIKTFFNELSDEFGQFDVYSPYNLPPGNLTEITNNFLTKSFDQFEFKVAVSLVLIVLLCLKIFSCSRKISIYKIDGCTSFNIYCRLFLIDYIKFNTIFLVLFSMLISIIYHSNLVTLLSVIVATILQFLQFILIILIVSILIYLVIFYTPILLSLKGSNKLNEVFSFAYFTKFLIILFTLPLVVVSLTSIKNLFLISYRHDSVYNKLQNYYSFGVQSSSNNYINDMGTENYIRLKEDIANHCDLFEMSKAKLIDLNSDVIDFEKMEDYYTVDKNYLIRMNLDEGCILDEICIYFPEDSNYDTQKWIDATKKLVSSEMRVNVIKYNTKLDAYSISDLLFSDYIVDAPLVYLPKEEGFDGQLNNSLFIFDGNLDEAQRFIDNKFVQYGYSPFFEVDSQQTVYQIYYNIYCDLYIKQIIYFMIMIIAYILANRLLIEVDIDNNRRRYEISSFEGVKPYGIFVYLCKIASPSILGLMGCIFAKKVIIDSSMMLVVLFIVIIEMILYMLFRYKYSNVRRYK